MRHKPHLAVEQLETRDLPAVSLIGSTLLAQADGRGDHTISADLAGDQVRVTLDGQTSSFAASAISRLVLVGGTRGENAIQNNTGISATLIGGPKRDVLFTGTGSDVALPGAGADVVYSLLGSHRIVTAGSGRDTIFSNPRNTVLSGREDQVSTFFDKGRVPGSGRVELDNGTLFITPTNGGTQTAISRDGRDLVVSTNFAGELRFRARDVEQIAYFGGSGDDAYTNDTDASDAFYGSAGNDTLIGGFGRFSLGKGSGGNDTLVGRARRNDLSGNGGADVLIALDGQGRNVFRADALDAIFGMARGDRRLSS